MRSRCANARAAGPGAAVISLDEAIAAQDSPHRTATQDQPPRECHRPLAEDKRCLSVVPADLQAAHASAVVIDLERPSLAARAARLPAGSALQRLHRPQRPACLPLVCAHAGARAMSGERMVRLATLWQRKSAKGTGELDNYYVIAFARRQ